MAKYPHQDDDCVKQKFAFTCQHARIFENCQATENREPCGFSGISEPECVEDFKCCFEPLSDVPCFKADGYSYKNPKKKGITNGGAAALTAERSEPTWAYSLVAPLRWGLSSLLR